VLGVCWHSTNLHEKRPLIYFLVRGEKIIIIINLHTFTKPCPFGISVVTDILPEISKTNTTSESLGPWSEIFGGGALIT
jgi:hypothetical protein